MEKKKNLKMLYITQAIDKDFYLLAPFYKWLNLLAERFEKIFAICLQEGAHQDLAGNIEVKSLGKEKGVSKLGYIFNFYKYCLPLIIGKKVDLIFVLMNELYVFMLWPLAVIFRIPIVIWRAHGSLNWKAKLVTKLAAAVLTSSETGHRIVTPKRKIIGQCVDPEHFPLKNNYPENPEKIIWVGRISRIKNLETLIEAAKILVKQEGIVAQFEILGSAPDQDGEKYLAELKNLVKRAGLSDCFKFMGSVDHQDLPTHYRQADIFVNTSDTGSLDKTVLEAMACGLFVINSNYGFNEILKDFPECRFKQGDYQDLAAKIKFAFSRTSDQRSVLGKNLRGIVAKDHALDSFIERLCRVLIEKY